MPFFYSDDPVRDAARHYAYQDRHYLPVCERCGREIEGRSHDVICYGTVCDDCYEHFREDEED